MNTGQAMMIKPEIEHWGPFHHLNQPIFTWREWAGPHSELNMRNTVLAKKNADGSLTEVSDLALEELSLGNDGRVEARFRTIPEPITFYSEILAIPYKPEE